jgi:fumarylacetoacetase
MGQTPVVLEDGSTRTSLADGDVLTLRGGCEREGFRSIGFGEAAGAVMPAVPA